MLEANRLPAGASIVPPSLSPVVGDIHETLLAKLLHHQAGGSGSELVSNAIARTYRTLGFTVITAATFAAVTADEGYSATGLTGVAYPVGTWLPFRLGGFQLTSGSVLAIKA